MKILSLNRQSYSDLIENNCIYVDKTEIIYKLITTGKNYFLARPRRFGKSLLCSTFQEIFLGNKELFKGCYIYKTHYKWDKFPVIYIDMSRFDYRSTDFLEKEILIFLDSLAESYGIKLSNERSAKIKLINFIEKLSKSKKSKVVVIVDEYDKPIIEHLNNALLAEEMRIALGNFYEALKASDKYIRFMFLTGVTKFSKTSIFSKLNNLEDLSMTEKSFNLLGYTQKELENCFKDYIKISCDKLNLSKKKLLENIKSWYNGFCFYPGSIKVYNPTSVMLFFSQNNFENFWFATGTPTFLINLIKKNSYPVPDISHAIVSKIDLAAFEIDNIKLLSLLMQTGYLTIKDYNQENCLYSLDYPNKEIKDSLNNYILESLSNLSSAKYQSFLEQFNKALKSEDINKFCEILYYFFVELPYVIHENLTKEKYFQNVFYLIMVMLGAEIDVEVETNVGRIDTVINTKNKIYLIEFKINKPASQAIKQIIKKKYYEKFISKKKKIILVGISFDTKIKNIKRKVIVKEI